MRKKNKIDWKAIRSDWRKMLFLVMLIIFVPSAVYLLATNPLWFFVLAAVFYLIIKLVKKD